MNKIKKLLFVLAAFTIIQSPAMAGDGHAHGKKGHKHSEKEMCVECKDKKDCKCEKEEIKVKEITRMQDIHAGLEFTPTVFIRYEFLLNNSKKKIQSRLLERWVWFY